MGARFERGRRVVIPVLLIAALSYPLTAATGGQAVPSDYGDYMGTSSSTAGLCPAPDSGYIGGWVCGYPLSSAPGTP